MDLMWTPELLHWFGQHFVAGAVTLGVGALVVAVGRDLSADGD